MYAETTEVMDYTAPADSSQIEKYKNLSATRWGMSPAFDINISDRIVLPDGVKTIKRMTLVPFRNREYKVLKGDDSGGRPVDVSVGFSSPGDVRMEIHEKTAYACAEEIRHAYANNNPWGFTVFNALTGLDAKVVSGILRAVLPKPLPLPEMIEYLQSVSPINIAETPWPEGELTRVNGQSLTCAEVAESVRAELLEGAEQASTFAEITLEETDEEIHQKAGGGKGKARADSRDKMLAEALNRPVPTVRQQTPVQPVAPSINPQLEKALAIFLQREAEKGGDDVEARIAEQVESRLTAKMEEYFAGLKSDEPSTKKGK